MDVADMHQRCTQSYVRRPYGVGLLVATYDQTGPHLYQTIPSGEYTECLAMAIGARSQTSRTYLEREFESFPDATLDELIKHALKALSVSLAGETELDTKSASISVVGADRAFEIIDGEGLQSYLDDVDQDGSNNNADADAGEDLEMEEPDM